MRCLWITAGVLAFAQTAGAHMSCSDATGTLQYKHISYVGGIPPRPGALVSTTQILVGGKVVSETRDYEGLNPERGPLSASFSEERLISQTDEASRFTRVTSALMTVKPNPIGTLPSTQAIGERLLGPEYVICKEVIEAVP